MYFAFLTADRVTSTLVPSETKPWLSGGLTDKSATSTGKILRLNKCGISPRKIGVLSARPSLTAFRTLPPMKSELSRNIPEKQLKWWNIFSFALLVWDEIYIYIYSVLSGRQNRATGPSCKCTSSQITMWCEIWLKKVCRVKAARKDCVTWLVTNWCWGIAVQPKSVWTKKMMVN